MREHNVKLNYIKSYGKIIGIHGLYKRSTYIDQ